MANIVILGAGIGGMPAAYTMKEALNKLPSSTGKHEVTVISNVDYFHFVPSNPWVAVGWRDKESITFEVSEYLQRKKINFISSGAKEIHAERSQITLHNGRTIDYDYLIIATGPRLAFELVDGLGPDGHTHSICHVDHAVEAYAAFEEFCKDPGPIIVGAVHGASCFGPAYEFITILETELRRRKIRDKVPMYYVTPEPYIGHLGLGGVGDSKGLLESELRNRHIKWITNAKTLKIDDGKMHLEEVNDNGEAIKQHTLDFKYAMMLPAFRGIPAVANVEGMCNPGGFVITNEYEQAKAFANIYSVGVCVAIPPVEKTPLPVGCPKTGYMIESMVTAAVHNIIHDIQGEAPEKCATWNAICLADMGDTGAAFVAIPQIPPRNMQWMKKGKWVHVAKVGFEKYFMRKMKKGGTDPFYEKWVLKTLGIDKLKD
ncbi:MAG: FAD/NAD(P)-binding oxidoreductase [Mariprofundales bacterium]